MSLTALLARLETEVPPVPTLREPEGTVKHQENQSGSLSSLGSLGKREPPANHRRWLIRHADDGMIYSHSMSPPATEGEVRAWYPDALSIKPEVDDDIEEDG